MSPRVPFPPQCDPRLRDAWNRLQRAVSGGGGTATLANTLFVSKDGKTAVQGFSVADCKPIGGDGIEIPVSWKGRADVGALSDTDARVVFELHKAKLYAFWID